MQHAIPFVGEAELAELQQRTGYQPTECKIAPQAAYQRRGEMHVLDPAAYTTKGAFPTPTDEDWDRETQLATAQLRVQYGQTPKVRDEAMKEVERLRAARSAAMLAWRKKHKQCA